MASCAFAQKADYASFDADAVRATYDKLAFAAQLGDIDDGKPIAPADKRLAFTLSNFKTGPLYEIRYEKVTNFVTLYGGRSLSVSLGGWSRGTGGNRRLNAQVASVDWVDNHSLFKDVPVSIEQAVTQMHEDERVSRYAAYTVDLSYAGEHRSYQALFFFGEDSSGQVFVRPVDNIIGNGELEQFVMSSPIPEPLLDPSFASNGDARAYLRSLRATPGCRPEPRTKMCCDQASGHCGVSAEALKGAGFDAP